MFDTIPSQQPSPVPPAVPEPAAPQANPSAAPAAPSAPVEDMFADIEVKTEKPAAFLPKQAGDPEAAAGEGGAGKRSLVPLYAAIGVLILAAGVYFGYGKVISLIDGSFSPAVTDDNPVEPTPDPSVTDPSVPVEPTPDPSVTDPSVPVEPTPDPSVPAADTDLDQDGLTDAEEEGLGTNAQSVDSDNDGLFDREEVRVYKTDPLNPDSDGDGFRDGDEVRGGYDPSGPGKLYELPERN